MRGSILLALACMVVAVMAPRAHVRAAFLITDIVANPPGANAGRQWVGVMNTSPDAIDLGAKTLRFLTTSGNHLIKAYMGGTILSAGASAVIAQNPLSFLNDEPNYAGTLLKSSFTLPMSGIVGIVQTDGTMFVEKSYIAAPEVKPGAAPKSSSKQATSHTSKTSTSRVSTKTKSYDNGTVAPAASAGADAAGAAFAWSPVLQSALAPFAPVFASVWFSLYLALPAFSSFSLIIIQRHYV